MKDSELKAIEEAVEEGRPVAQELGLSVLRSGNGDMPRLFAAATKLRERRFGSVVRLCSILNARSGACTEDCAFCAQAACHKTGVNAKAGVKSLVLTFARRK